MSTIRELYLKKSQTKPKNVLFFLDDTKLEETEARLNVRLKDGDTLRAIDSFKIVVKTEDGKDRYCELSINSKLFAFRKTVALDIGVNVALLQLRYRGKILSNDVSLKSLDIKEGSTIESFVIRILKVKGTYKNIPKETKICFYPNDTIEILKERYAEIIKIPLGPFYHKNQLLYDTSTVDEAGLKHLDEVQAYTRYNPDLPLYVWDIEDVSDEKRYILLNVFFCAYELRFQIWVRVSTRFDELKKVCARRIGLALNEICFYHKETKMQDEDNPWNKKMVAGDYVVVSRIETKTVKSGEAKKW